MLNRVRQPFNVNALAQAAALAALGRCRLCRARAARSTARAAPRCEEGVLRSSASPSCRRTPISCWSKVGDAARAYQRLLEQGVIVRPVANYALPEWLRVTVGVARENRRFLDALDSALAG